MKANLNKRSKLVSSIVRLYKQHIHCAFNQKLDTNYTGAISLKHDGINLIRGI
jgi:hypothetical protein